MCVSHSSQWATVTKFSFRCCGRSEADLDAIWGASRRGQARWSECTAEATTPEAARQVRL
ncbi:hypothetical protein IG631_21821 [Alternaria alternata]|nr:hypothetical protein IG631_21821 [Alternaria alternata]